MALVNPILKRVGFPAMPTLVSASGLFGCLDGSSGTAAGPHGGSSDSSEGWGAIPFPLQLDNKTVSKYKTSEPVIPLFME